MSIVSLGYWTFYFCGFINIDVLPVISLWLRLIVGRDFGLRIVVAADHAGFHLKELLINFLEEMGHEVINVGALEFNAADDYPDFTLAASLQVKTKIAERGIVLCGSGVGASIVANKVRGIRASICHDTYSARQGVEHDDMNLLCLGARIVGEELAKELVTVFVSSVFTGDKRHVRRLEKVSEIEENNMKSKD